MAGEITLTMRQILNLCEFVGIAININESVFFPSGEEYLLDTEYAIAQNEQGAVSYLYEYPEEGGYPLSGDPRLFKECGYLRGASQASLVQELVGACYTHSLPVIGWPQR